MRLLLRIYKVSLLRVLRIRCPVKSCQAGGEQGLAFCVQTYQLLLCGRALPWEWPMSCGEAGGACLPLSQSLPVSFPAHATF